MLSVSMNYVFESLYTEKQESGTPDEKSAIQQQQWVGTIKMMDTILFKQDFQPVKWIFTDLLGRIQFKDINQITINDVIRAFLVNLNDNKKNEFNNDDLMEFLASNNRQKICFALCGNQRFFLDIGSLSNIKSIYSKGIDALQLYKIPTRDFIPYFYLHTLNFKQNGAINSHMITRVSHSVKDLGKKSGTQITSEFYEESIPTQEYEYFAYQMLEISKQLILKIQQRDATRFVKAIKITYLVEISNYDPWFIGTEYCHLQTKLNADLHRKDQDSLANITHSTSRVLRSRTANKSFQRATKLNSNLSRSKDTSGQDTTNRSKQEDVYELSNLNYVTESELMRGLKQIGQTYGKDSQEVKIKRPKTIQVLTEEKSRKMLRYSQQIQDQRSQLKEKGRRIISLFPKYLEKSGSKAHSSFLFGNVSSDRVFKEYQRLRFQKQLNTDSLIMYAGPKSQNQTQNSFYPADGNKSIFDIPMSEAPEKDTSYEQPYMDSRQQQKGRFSEYANQDLSQINEQLILQQDISMFQRESDINHENYSIKDSMLSQKLQQANDHIGSNLLQIQPAEEKQMLLGKDEFEKDLIKLLMINQDLKNVVVIDKETAQSRVRLQMKYQDLEQQIKAQQSQGDRIFSERRRKLNSDETKSYLQWKQFFNQQQSINEISDVDASRKMGSSYKQRRSQTMQGFKKVLNNKNERKQKSVLNRLQIKGKEAEIFNVSKAELKKQYIDIQLNNQSHLSIKQSLNKNQGHKDFGSNNIAEIPLSIGIIEYQKKSVNSQNV